MYQRQILIVAGAPEIDRKIREANSSIITQKIDTFSFGCILSISATWVVAGIAGIEQFSRLREQAIKKLRDHKVRDKSVNVPEADDAFHDGKDILPEVLHWHNYLRTIIRVSDHVSTQVLDLVDEKLLRSEPEQRISSEIMWDDLQRILRDVDFKRDIEHPKEAHESVLDVIHAFETSYTENAKSARISSVRSAQAEVEAQSALLTTNARDGKPRQSKRLGKSLRYHLPVDAMQKGAPKADPDRLGVSHRHMDDPTGHVSLLARGGLSNVTESKIEEKYVQLTRSREQKAVGTAYPEDIKNQVNLRRFHSDGKQPLTGKSSTHVRRKSSTSKTSLVSTNRPPGSPESGKEAPAESHQNILSPVVHSQKSRFSFTPGEIAKFSPDNPTAISESPNGSVISRSTADTSRIDPSLDISKVRRELESTSRARLLHHPKADKFLKDFINKRDMVK